jgi:transcriptional regulator of aromatic amino acid metabolism
LKVSRKDDSNRVFEEYKAAPPQIPLLVNFFLERFVNKIGRKINAIRKETMDLLMDYAWPGNIRELQNIIERAVVLSAGPVLICGPRFSPNYPCAERSVPHCPCGTSKDRSPRYGEP